MARKLIPYSPQQWADLCRLGNAMGVDLNILKDSGQISIEDEGSRQANFGDTARLMRNIQAISAEFANCGLDASRYLIIGVITHHLLFLKPDKKIRKLRMLMDAAARGNLAFPAKADGTEGNLGDFIAVYPTALSVSEEFLQEAIELAAEQKKMNGKPPRKLYFERARQQNLRHLIAANAAAPPVQEETKNHANKTRQKKTPQAQGWHVSTGENPSLAYGSISITLDASVASVLQFIQRHGNLTPTARTERAFLADISDRMFLRLVGETRMAAIKVQRESGAKLPLLSGDYRTEGLRFTKPGKVSFGPA